ncbi:hypothetical protein DEO72_LG2g4992 [Vigna unguiculata]|uniref:Uncharacterized protein n=1 Tax=Vigna unguiculata TaxID=3917 RepID=A0A4D6L7Y1_VIGUN|nr:hypothetical protein DEO72_LG2g4992 [Vigna unguiculata]
MEVVFASSFLDGGTGFWNLRATVEMLCYKSRSLPRLRCPACFIAASKLQNPLCPLRYFMFKIVMANSSIAIYQDNYNRKSYVWDNG